MEGLSLTNIGSLIGTIKFQSLIAIILLRNVLGNFNRRLDKLDKRLVQLNKSIVLMAKTLNHLTKEEVLSINDAPSAHIITSQSTSKTDSEMTIKNRSLIFKIGCKNKCSFLFIEHKGVNQW